METAYDPGGLAKAHVASLRVTINPQDELDAFVRYSRLGLFQKADEVYNEILGDSYETLFPVTAEMADSLLERGRFRRLLALTECRLRQAESFHFKKDEIDLLRLLKAIANLYCYGDLRSALEVARSWRRQAAATFMTPVTLSVVDKMSLQAYLRVVTFASDTSNWLLPQDMQPPWTESHPQPWSGFCELFMRMSGDLAEAWNARGLFKLLMTSVSQETATELFKAWLRQREAEAKHPAYETDEEELLADLSITVAYARRLLDSQKMDGEFSDDLKKLKDRCAHLEYELTRLVRQVDDLTDIQMRPSLELALVFPEVSALIQPRRHTWEPAQRNLDLVTGAGILPLLFSNHEALGFLDFGFKLGCDHLLHDMGNMVGYLTFMTNKIMSSYRAKVLALPAASPTLSSEASTTGMDGFIREWRCDATGLMSFETFQAWLDSSAMTVPQLRYRGLVACLIIAESRDERWEAENAKERILEEVHHCQHPFHYMVETGYCQGVKLLLKSGADLEAKNNEGQTPLSIAIKDGDVTMIKLLLAHHGDLQAKSTGQLPRVPKSFLGVIVDLLRDKREGVRHAAFNSLEKEPILPDDTLRAIVALLGDKAYDSTRKGAIEILAKRPILSDNLVRSIMALLRDQNWYFREGAAHILGRRPTLPAWVFENILALLPDHNWYIGKEAAHILERRPTLPAWVFDNILALLGNPIKKTRNLAVMILGKRPDLPDSVLGAIMEKLRDEDRQIRHPAIEILRKRPTLPMNVLDGLVAHLDHSDWYIRGGAVEILGNQEVWPGGVLQAITARLQDPERSVQVEASNALKKYNERPPKSSGGSGG